MKESRHLPCYNLNCQNKKQGESREKKHLGSNTNENKQLAIRKKKKTD